MRRTQQRSVRHHHAGARAGDSGIRSFASVQGALVMYPIHAFGSEQQKNEWLPKLASGDAIGCFGLTEPDYGSDPGGMITTAKETDDGWVLNGAKMWITNGSTASVAIIWAKTGDLADRKSIRGFIVPTASEGFSSKDQHGKLSLRASDTSELVLQDVLVPRDALLPESEGLKSPLMCLTQARYGIAWGAVGGRDGVLRGGSELREEPGDVRQADCQISNSAGTPGGDVDGDYEGAVALLTARPAEGRRYDETGASVPRQAKQCEHRNRGRT